MIFGKPDWKTFQKGIEKEWLLTNGLGSFASSTIIGANTRRYHGLLVASLRYPVRRHLLISKFDENVEIDNKTYDLSTNHTPDYTGDGYKYLQTVEVDKTVNFTYNIKDVFIEKHISMVHGKNTVVVVYKILNGISHLKLKIYPLVNYREYHGNSYKSQVNFITEASSDGIIIKPSNSDLNIELRASEGRFNLLTDTWFFNMDYITEQERGLNPIEDHYMPGYFEFSAKPNEEKTITVIGSLEGIQTMDGPELIIKEEERLQNHIDLAGFDDSFANALVLAADKFIVNRESTGAKTIIAGYPWFTDWGRDTMIALPGLTLVTNRFEDAKEIFISFAKHVKDGLIPNMFPDIGREPLYNTVDASLWFFEAVFKFLKYSSQYQFIKENIYPALKEIIEGYRNGTHFNIGMDIDGLIYSGSSDVQLTWMDAKVNDWVVTPRHGKAVEINALWYNALKIMSILSRKYGEDHTYYEKLAIKVKKSFEIFWNNEKECLYDVIEGFTKDDKIRPNQILALSLSYPVISDDRANKIVDKVFHELYATFGLRSLSTFENEYKGIYIGNQLSRDSAYHQGTVWAWLIGPFITAYRRVHGYSKESAEFCLKLIEPFVIHLHDAGIGSISEIFDGDEPHMPRGCFAQAWSVAEILRSYAEDIVNKE